MADNDKLFQKLENLRKAVTEAHERMDDVITNMTALKGEDHVAKVKLMVSMTGMGRMLGMPERVTADLMGALLKTWGMTDIHSPQVDEFMTDCATIDRLTFVKVGNALNED